MYIAFLATCPVLQCIITKDLQPCFCPPWSVGLHNTLCLPLWMGHTTHGVGLSQRSTLAHFPACAFVFSPRVAPTPRMWAHSVRKGIATCSCIESRACACRHWSVLFGSCNTQNHNLAKIHHADSLLLPCLSGLSADLGSVLLRGGPGQCPPAAMR